MNNDQFVVAGICEGVYSNAIITQKYVSEKKSKNLCYLSIKIQDIYLRLCKECIGQKYYEYNQMLFLSHMTISKISKIGSTSTNSSVATRNGKRPNGC